MNFVFIGLSITSSWGNGHATTYRALIKELAKLGHEILFLEKDVPYYADQRDMPEPAFCELSLYKTFDQFKSFKNQIAEADIVIVGSYVADGVKIGEWVIKTANGATAFYDIDTPVTLAKLKDGDYEYINPDLIAKYDMYLSFSGGPILSFLEDFYNSPLAKPLYCSVDTEIYYPENIEKKWDLGYLGTYSPDRQPGLEEFLIRPAQKLKENNFVVAGPQYPQTIAWPANVQRIDHLSPDKHRHFYNSQRFTLNITRRDMIEAGFSPSVRLFEAAACAVPVISDYWNGIETFFEPGEEILITRASCNVVSNFREISESEQRKIGNNAREKILKHHTAKARAKQLENYAFNLTGASKETQKISS